jgi:hypothetical protein
MDSLKNLSRGSGNLFLHKLVQSLSGRLDVFDRKKILYPFDCVVLSKELCPHVGEM